MNYRALRYQIYRHEVKQLMAAISHIGALFALLFINVLVPVFLMLALMAVAFIADDDMPMGERIVYQGIYLIFLYVVIKVQAKAVRGSAYHYYLQDLPISRRRQFGLDVELTLQAGNLVLLAPLGLCGFLPDLATLIENLFFVVFALSLFIVTSLALYRRNIPVVSLVAVPLAATTVAQPYLTAIGLNALWGLSLLLELMFIDRVKLDSKSFKVLGYSQLVLQFVLHRPVNWVSRLLGALALVASYAYIVGQRPDLAGIGFEAGVGFIVALILGSYQFEVERFRSQYRHYLAGLPITTFAQRRMETLPLLVLNILLLSLASGWFGYSWPGLVGIAVMTSLAAIGVRWLNRYYFVPSLLLLLLFYGLY